MTASTHVYEAHVTGDPDMPLSVKGGRITLDAGRAPHIEADLRIAAPDAATLAALDPRNTPRVTLTVDATFPSYEHTRTFDLGVRDLTAREESADLDLSLASDEALLSDYAPLTDDLSPRVHQASLRAIVDYVLGEAIPGAALEADPSHDADMTAYWPATNIIPNPSVVGSLGTYYVTRDGTSAVDYSTAVGGALGTASCVRWTASGTGISQVSARQHSAKDGTTYTFSAYVRSPNSRSMRFRLFWRDSENELIRQVASPATVAANNWDTRISFTATAPQGTSRVGVVIERVSGTNGEFLYADMLSMIEGDWLQPYFDGSTTPAGYTTEWGDVGHQSPSTRTPIIDRDPEALTWRAGQAAIDFLLPLAQSAGLRLVCDEERRWTLRDENYTAPGALSIRYGVNMTAGGATISRDAGLWFDGRITRYTWRRNGETYTKSDSYALTTSPTRVTMLELDTPYPGPGRSEYAVRRAQGRGREINASAVADWRAHAEMPLAVTLSNSPLQTGLVQSIAFDLDNDEMTVTGRTTDTPELAWTLGPTDLTWADAAPVIWDDLTEWSDL